VDARLWTAGAMVLSLAGCSGGGGVTYPYPPRGSVSRTVSGAFEWLRDDPSLPAACGLQDNRWNARHAAQGPAGEQVFVEDLDSTPAFGWQWLWPDGNDVVTYPEVICGTKPWDMGSAGYTGGGALPFTAGAATLAVDYDVTLESRGIHTLSFSLWTVTDTAHPLATIANEIMIWIDAVNMAPTSVAPQGSVEAGGTTFDAYIWPDQYDHSGGSDARWTYTALVAREPVQHGPLDLAPLLHYLRTHDVNGGTEGAPVLAEDASIASLELGTEIVGGAGVVEVTGFDFTVTPLR